MDWEPLMSVVVDVVLFLELSGREVIDEDAAVGAMEQLAAELQRLGPTERHQFVGYLRRRADSVASYTPRQRECIRGMAGNLGLSGE